MALVVAALQASAYPLAWMPSYLVAYHVTAELATVTERKLEPHPKVAAMEATQRDALQLAKVRPIDLFNPG